MLVYEIGIISAFITVFLNYCIGKPGGEFSPYEIFSGYTVWLAKRRLQRYNILQQYYVQFEESIKDKKPYEVVEISNDFKRIIYNAAEPFFTWERAIGMCSICTGFWISLLFGLIFTFDILQLAEIIVISHITIRLSNKIL